MRVGRTARSMSTEVRHVNVPFSHPSEVYPQKDGRKVRSRDEAPLTLGAAPAPPRTSTESIPPGVQVHAVAEGAGDQIRT